MKSSGAGGEVVLGGLGEYLQVEATGYPVHVLPRTGELRLIPSAVVDAWRVPLADWVDATAILLGLGRRRTTRA